MKFAHPEISKVFDTQCGHVHTIVIENQAFFCQLIMDLRNQMSGMNGQCVVSDNNMPLSCAKCIDVLDGFVPFDINRKPLITKLISALEKRSADSQLWERSGKLLLDLEDYLDELAFEYPCDIVFPKLSISGVIKSAGPEFRDEYQSIGEKVIDYMELVRTFDREKLFFFINMRSFVADEEMERFLQTVLSHGFHVILLESSDRKRLTDEERFMIDEDLCEID